MAIQTGIKPSREARLLFNEMVNHADEETLHLSLGRTLELAVTRKKAGHNDTLEISELVNEEWVRQARDGGWLLAGTGTATLLASSVR